MTHAKSPITAHVLDTNRGRPASGVPVTIEVERAGNWEKLGTSVTNDDGRVPNLLTGRVLESARYRVTFSTAVYFAELGTTAFYPYVQVVFDIRSPTEHYHIPLLLSLHGYSTYRGS